MIQDEGPETICAFIGDTHSVYGATPPRDYFTILREICDKHGILMICDEVVTGFGRTGKMFACDGQFDFVPDIMTLGKGVTSGYLPLSATIISDRVREAFNGAPRSTRSFPLFTPMPGSRRPARPGWRRSGISGRSGW